MFKGLSIDDSTLAGLEFNHASVVNNPVVQIFFKKYSVKILLMKPSS